MENKEEDLKEIEKIVKKEASFARLALIFSLLAYIFSALIAILKILGII